MRLNCINLFAADFVVYFGFLFEIVMNQNAQERLFTVKVLKAFLFSRPIFVFTIHIFRTDYNCYQRVNIIQRLPHNLTVALLLHKYAYTLVKYSQNVA